MAYKTPEKKVQDKVLEYLKQLEAAGHPIFYERRQATATSKKGLPDIYMIYAGVHIEIEVKEPNGVQSVAQEKWEIKFAKMGVPYLLIKDINEFKEFVENNLIGYNEEK